MAVQRIERVIDELIKELTNDDVRVLKFTHDEDYPRLEIKWQITFADNDFAESFIHNWNNNIKKVKRTREFKAPYSTLKGFPIEFENYGSDEDGVVVVGTLCWYTDDEGSTYFDWFQYYVNRVKEILLINVNGSLEEDKEAFYTEDEFWGEIEYLR